MLDVQHVIGLEQHVELYDPLPLTHDEEDEDNIDFLGYDQIISVTAFDSVFFTPYPQSYSVHSYKPRKLVDHLYMYLHPKTSNSSESFTCKIYNLHVEIIK